MSTPSVLQVLRVPGRLVLNPTDLSTTFPYGGTALGLVRDTVVHIVNGTREITAEEFGNTVTEVVLAGTRLYISCALRAFDNDALAAIFPEASTQSGSGDKGLTYNPSTGIRAGKKLSDMAAKILFAPVDEERDFFVYFPKAIPHPEETAKLELSFEEEIGVDVSFKAIPDATFRVCLIKKRQDLIGGL